MKYESLRTYLEHKSSDEVPMTFSEIEKVIGSKLPASQQYPAWWSNNPSNNRMTEAWLAAGYKTERVDIAGRKLVFKRASDRRNQKQGGPSPSRRFAEGGALSTERKPHPLFGALAGLAKTAPGVDLTEPADPAWGERP
jgi:hypothetical protein